MKQIGFTNCPNESIELFNNSYDNELIGIENIPNQKKKTESN